VETLDLKTGSEKSNGNHTPAYKRIEEDIRSKIRDGRLPSGTMLAGRHNLAREYGVALSTAQQAVANLIAEGALATFDRRGTFVSNGHQVAQETSPSSDRTQIETVLLKDVPPSLPRSATVGIVATARIDPTGSPDVGSLWARLAIRSLEQVVSSAGGTTHFFERYPESGGPYAVGLNDPNAISLKKAIESLLDAGVHAIAVVGLCDIEDMSDEVLSAIDIDRTPVVYLSWHEIQPPLAQVFYDNRFAGYQAAQHLLRKGCDEIVFLNPFEATWVTERIEGAYNAIRHAGLPQSSLRLYPNFDERNPFDIRTTAHSVIAMADDLLEGALRDGPSNHKIGIIAPQDEVAYAVLGAASRAGKDAGQDFGLIGFDDDPRSCALGLSTIRPPVEAMGQEAGRMLLGSVSGEKNGLQVRMHSHLIPRSSTRMTPLLQSGTTGHGRSKRKEAYLQISKL
jgi:DNA-binding LacI/PurR family transcriptional regulator/DNA-binding transcriptional regulator YhcF (GntR family)